MQQLFSEAKQYAPSAKVVGSSCAPQATVGNLSAYCNFANVHIYTANPDSSFQLTNSTLKRYLLLLESVYLVVPLQPWLRNLGKRLVKSPKLFLNDTGLLCHLLETNAKGLERKRQLLDFAFDNFVLMELIKQIAWSKTQPAALHFRTLTGQEVDIVLESRSGKIVGIECKSSSSVKLDDFKDIQYLKEQAGDSFHRGIVIYTGSETLSFGEDLIAMPVSALCESAVQFRAPFVF